MAKTDFLTADMTRRQFMKISGKSLAGLTLSASMLSLFGCSQKQVDSGAVATWALPQGLLVVNADLCTGCQRCEINCTLTNDGVCSSYISRVKIQRRLNLDGAGNGLLRDMLGIRGEEFNILGAEAEGEPGEIRLSSADDSAALDGTTTRLWQNDVNVTGEHAQVLATYAGEEADEWELDGTAAVTRNPYGSGEAYFVGCDLDVADLTKLVRAYLAASSQENADVLHTVRASADATFDFYLPRGKKTVELQGIEGEPVILFQTDREEKPGSYTVRRNGVLVVRR